MTEDPPNPQDDETPDAAGDVAEPEQSADPSESPAEQPATDADAPAEAQAEAPAEEPAAEAPAEEPAAEAPAEEPAAEAPAEEPAAEAPAEEPAADAPAEELAAEATAADAPPEDRPKPKARKGEAGDSGEPEVVPGAHLEPDLVLETAQETPDEFGAYGQTYDEPGSEGESADGAEAPAGGAEAAPARKPLDLAADARYPATGKRKTAIARVILKPGSGTYTINGRPLEVFFPRQGLQLKARGPLQTAGYESRMDVVAKIHGGGVSAQAGALRHGIARALVEADPNLRTELKREGFLTRDARVKERKKAGLKKARKRPQFSKR